MMAAGRNVEFRPRKGRLFKSNLNQQHENELEETVSLNESAFVPVPAPMDRQHSQMETGLSPPLESGSQQQMATRELIGRTAVVNTLKKMPSEPYGLTALSRNETGTRQGGEKMKAKPSPLENYAVLEELGDSAYGKTYRVKRVFDGRLFTLKCIAHQMRRPPNNDTSTINRRDARALAILVRELLSQHRINGHPNFLTLHDSWFTIYDLDDVPATPSLGQPFDLNRFSLDRLRRNHKNGFKKATEDEELVDFDLYGLRLLTALMKEQSSAQGGPRGSGSIMIVLYMVLDDCQYDLHDYFSAHHKKSTQVNPVQIFLEFLQIALVLYDCDMVHLGTRPTALGLVNVSHHHLTPRLLDFGINRYFEVYLKDIRYSPLQPSVFQAPEVELAEGMPEVGLTWPSDVYSLGLVFASFCLADDANDSKALKELKAGNLHLLDGLDGIPTEIRQMIKQMLALDPENRPTPWDILDTVAPVIPSDGLLSKNLHECSTLSNSSRLRLSIEMHMLRARLQHRAWLTQVPKSLWLGVVQSCAKEILERYLDHLGNLDPEKSGQHSNTVPSIIFDVRFMLRSLNLDLDIAKCMERATADEAQLFRATVWYLWQKFVVVRTDGTSEQTDGEHTAFGGMTWIRELKDLYGELWGDNATLSA